MNTRAIGRLASLSFVRMAWGLSLAVLVWLISLVAIPYIGLTAMAFVGVMTWFIGMLLGMTLRTLTRTESRLLPDFSRILGQLGLLYALILIALPALLELAFTGNPRHATLMAATQLLALTLGLASGTGIRVATFAWIIFPIMGFLPKSTHATLLQLLTSSYWVPLLIALLAAWLLRFTLRPFLTVSDQEVDDSPLQAIAEGRKPAYSTSGMPQRRGFIGRKLKPVLDATAECNLARAVRKFQRKPDAASRMAVIRAVLLPHDNWQGVAINLLVTAVIATLYFLLVDRDNHMDVGLIASYAILLGMSRFSAVGRGMVKMQPNLADLYLTLAPETQAAFQATIAEALLKLVAVTTFNCVIYSVLVAVLLHAHAPADIVLSALIVGVGASFGALAAHLVGPTSNSGRIMVQMALLIGAMIIYNLVLWLMHHFGVLIGGLGGIVICVPFGLGAWRYARCEYMARRPVFDTPLDS